jgi:hypothetical protein
VSGVMAGAGSMGTMGETGEKPREE